MADRVPLNNWPLVSGPSGNKLRRFSVTMVSYCRGCLIAMYLSTFIMAKWDSDAIPNTLKAILDNSVLIQYVLEVFPCSSAITQEIKRGWPITPIIPSVEDKQAIAKLDLVFTRCLVFTAIMIRAFRANVIGEIMMLMTVTKTMKANEPIKQSFDRAFVGFVTSSRFVWTIH